MKLALVLALCFSFTVLSGCGKSELETTKAPNARRSRLPAKQPRLAGEGLLSSAWIREGNGFTMWADFSPTSIHIANYCENGATVSVVVNAVVTETTVEILDSKSDVNSGCMIKVLKSDPMPYSIESDTLNLNGLTFKAY